MSSGAASPTLYNTYIKPGVQAVGSAVTGTVAAVSSAVSKPASDPSAPVPHGGARRSRNNRGRFLSKRKAALRTLKKRAAKAVTVGTKAQVFHGTAKHTSGGLTRKDLMKTKKGRIVSKRKHAAGRAALRRLKAAGYLAKKGTFKLFRK